MIKTIFILGIIILSQLFFSCENNNNNQNQKGIFPDTGTSKSSVKFSTYCNNRYSYCIKFPSNILIPQGESDSEDGQKFQTKDGKSFLVVYRDFSDIVDYDLGFSLKTLFDQETLKKEEGKTITYKLLGKDFMVISSIIDNSIGESTIFYRKSILKDDQLITAVLTYRIKDKKIFEPLIKEIFDSFYKI